MQRMTFIIAEKPKAARDIADTISLMINEPVEGSKYGKFLKVGNNIIGNARGHLIELFEPQEYYPAWGQWKFETLPMIPEVFKSRPCVIKKKNAEGKVEREDDKSKIALLNSIQRACKDADIIINAGDSGREGQLIVDEILDFYGFLHDSSKEINRYWFSELSPTGLEKAIKEQFPNKTKEGFYIAGCVRSKADWLFGLNLSRAISLAYKQAGSNEMLSIGRVQTPTMYLVYLRDRDIKNFVPKDYYTFSVLACNEKNNNLQGNLVIDAKSPLFENSLDDAKRIIDIKFIEKLKNQLLQMNDGEVNLVTKKRKQKLQKPLYCTTTIQQECSKKFKLSLKQTDEILQKMYEAGLISYPRTASESLALTQKEDVNIILQSLDRFLDTNNINYVDLNKLYMSKAWNDAGVTDHHAIIPTQFNISEYNNLNNTEKSIYLLIVKRFISHFIPPMIYDEFVINFSFNITNEEKLFFSNTSNQTIDKGWTIVYQGEDEDDKKSENIFNPELFSQGQKLKLFEEPEIVTSKTTPPKKFDESDLAASLDNISKHIPISVVNNPELAPIYHELMRGRKGIGTVATRTQIIETLKTRGFLQSGKNNVLDITEKGICLIENLRLLGLEELICSPIQTAKFELMLGKIEENKFTEEDFMKAFIPELNNILNIIKDQNNISKIKVIKTEYNNNYTQNTQKPKTTKRTYTKKS